jgi:hypothetical protein
LISLIGIIGVTRVLSFSRNFSVDKAGLREAARVFSLIGIIGVTRVLRFSRNFSVDRAGLREAARVLGDIIWPSGL